LTYSEIHLWSGQIEYVFPTPKFSQDHHLLEPPPSYGGGVVPFILNVLMIIMMVYICEVCAGITGIRGFFKVVALRHGVVGGGTICLTVTGAGGGSDVTRGA